MPVFRGSRYQGVPFTPVKFADGTIKKFLHNRKPFKLDDLGGRFSLVERQLTEQLDEFSFKVGNRERLWWLIADVNELDFVLDFEPGQRLAIPASDVFSQIP